MSDDLFLAQSMLNTLRGRVAELDRKRMDSQYIHLESLRFISGVQHAVYLLEGMLYDRQQCEIETGPWA